MAVVANAHALQCESPAREGPSSPGPHSAEIGVDQIFALNDKSSRFAVPGALRNGMEVMLRFFQDPTSAVAADNEDGGDRGAAASFVQRCTAHRNVLSVVGICQELGAVVIEVCQPLREFLVGCSDVSLRLAAQMGLGCVEGLIYLHETVGEVWCRDGNPLEFFVAGNTIKVADDQVSRSAYFGRQEERMGYTAPETLASSQACRDNPHTVNVGAADVYSVGIVMWCLLSRSEPWHDKSPDEIKQRVLTGERLSVPDAIVRNLHQERSTQSYLTLMKNCWHENESDRPTLMEVHGGLQKILALIEEEEEEQEEDTDMESFIEANSDSIEIPYNGPQMEVLPPMESTRSETGLIALLRRLWRAVARLLQFRRSQRSSMAPPPPAYDAIGIRVASPQPAIGVPFDPYPVQVSPFAQPPPLAPLEALCGTTTGWIADGHGLGSIMVVDHDPNQVSWEKVRGYSVNCILPDSTKHPMWNDIVVIAIGNVTVPTRRIWDHFLDIFFNTSSPEFRQSEHWDIMRPWLMKPMVPNVEGDSIMWTEPERGFNHFEKADANADSCSRQASSSQDLPPVKLCRQAAMASPLDTSDFCIDEDWCE